MEPDLNKCSKFLRSSEPATTSQCPGCAKSGEENQAPDQAAPPGIIYVRQRTQTCIMLLQRMLMEVRWPICQTSQKNEPKTLNSQIRAWIRAKNRPNWSSKTNPNEPDFRGRKGAKSGNEPSEPKKRTQAWPGGWARWFEVDDFAS